MKWKTFIQIIFIIGFLGVGAYLLLLRIKPIDRYDFKESTFDIYVNERTFSRKAIIKMDKTTGRSWELEQGAGLTGAFTSQWRQIDEASR